MRALADPTIAPLTIAAAVLSLLSRCWIRAIVAWALFLSVIIAFGLDGRPAVLHTYYPVPVLLLFASLESGLRPEVRKPMYRVIPWTVLLGALAMMLSVNVSENKMLRERSELRARTWASSTGARSMSIGEHHFPQSSPFRCWRATPTRSPFAITGW